MPNLVDIVSNMIKVSKLILSAQGFELPLFSGSKANVTDIVILSFYDRFGGLAPSQA